MNSVSAVVHCSRLMRKLMKNTSPSVPSISTIIAGPLKIVWPNDGQADDRAGRVGDDRGI